MSNVEQLLAKAMSTSSEDEAIACLRMARKRNAGDAVGTEQNSAYWKQKAEYYYKIAQENQLMYRSMQSSTNYWQRRWNDTDYERIKLRRLCDASELKLFKYRMAVSALISICVIVSMFAVML